MTGIKETKEVVEGMLELSVLLAEVFKDGVQASDFLQIMMSLQSDPRFLEAIKGIQKIPAELVDIDLDESYELLGAVLPYMKKLVATLTSK